MMHGQTNIKLFLLAEGGSFVSKDLVNLLFEDFYYFYCRFVLSTNSVLY